MYIRATHYGFTQQGGTPHGIATLVKGAGSNLTERLVPLFELALTCNDSLLIQHSLLLSLHIVIVTPSIDSKL